MGTAIVSQSDYIIFSPTRIYNYMMYLRYRENLGDDQVRDFYR